MTNLQTEKEERERIVNAIEMHFSDMEKNYKFNHEYGDWYDNKRNDCKRRTLLLKSILLHHIKHTTKDDMRYPHNKISRFVI